MLILSTCLAFVCSCKTQRNTPNEIQPSSFAKNDKGFELEAMEAIKSSFDFSLATGSCFGECPVFEFFYLKDSVAILSSKKYLLEGGDYYYLLKKEDIQYFNELLNQNWESFERDYKSPMNDFPPYTFQIKLESELKTIRVLGKEPSDLKNLKESIIRKITKLEWKKIEQ